MIRVVEHSDVIRIHPWSVHEKSYACPTTYTAVTDDDRKIVFNYRYGTLRVWLEKEEGDYSLLYAYVFEDTTDGYMSWEDMLKVTDIKLVDEDQDEFSFEEEGFQHLLEGLKDDPAIHSVNGYYNPKGLPKIVATRATTPELRLNISAQNPDGMVTITVQIHDHIETYKHRFVEKGGSDRYTEEVVFTSTPEEFIEDRQYRECVRDCLLAAYEDSFELFE